MKNIVLLKNLLSNLVDEAIVILKSNKHAKKLQMDEKNTTAQFYEIKNDKDYVIKEAKGIISNYNSRVEKTKRLEGSHKINLLFSLNQIFHLILTATILTIVIFL